MTNEYVCTIDAKLPSLNDYIAVCRRNKFEAAAFKRDVENVIAVHTRHLPRFERPISIHFLWIEKDGRRDYDNIAAAKKFILDALVKTGKLKDDNRKCVIGFKDTFGRGVSTKVILFIKEAEQ